MSRLPALRASLHPSLTISHAPANGDCLFSCLSLAFPPHTVASLRRLVSEAIDEEQLALFTVAHEAGVEGYEFMKASGGVPPSLARVRAAWLVTGAGPRARYVVWGEQFALQVLATELRVRLLVYDEQAPAACRCLAVHPSGGGGG
ncbi:hypothetical protein TeGR_g12810, partial [Tetraparma gracilis]